MQRPIAATHPRTAALRCRTRAGAVLFRVACVLALLCPATVWLSAGVAETLRIPAEEQEEHPASPGAGSLLVGTASARKSRLLRRVSHSKVSVAGRLACRVAHPSHPADGHRLTNGLTAPLRC